MSDMTRYGKMGEANIFPQRLDNMFLARRAFRNVAAKKMMPSKIQMADFFRGVFSGSFDFQGKGIVSFFWRVCFSPGDSISMAIT